MSETMELAVVNAANAVEIFTKGGLSAILDGIEAKVRAIDLDGSTAKGRDEIRSTAYKVARTKTALDAEAKKLTEGWRESTKQVNDERKRAQERLDALADEVRAPLTAFENKEKNRIAAHEAAIAELGAWASIPQQANADELRHELERFTKLHADRAWEEFDYRAKKLRVEIELTLSDRLERRIKSDTDQAELARLRKEEAERQVREREERLKSEAAEKARAEAERKAKQAADEEAHRVIEAARKEEERVKAEAARIQAEHERAAFAAAQESRKETYRLEAEARAIEQKRIAEENARLDAERRLKESEQARIAAENKAKADKKSAEERAAADLKAAIAREQERVEKQRRDEESARLKREADAKLRAKIRQEISEDLFAFREGDVFHAPLNAEEVIDAIMDGKVRHVRVTW